MSLTNRATGVLLPQLVEPAPGLVCQVGRSQRVWHALPVFPRQPHVPGALHDVPDGSAARGLLASADLLQELAAGRWRRRHHVCDERLLQPGLLGPLQEGEAPGGDSRNVGGKEEAAGRFENANFYRLAFADL